MESLQKYIEKEEVKARLVEVLGSRVNIFVSSLIAAVNSNEELKRCEPNSIIQAAIMAASLNLPINQSIGHAYIIPYSGKAQFQIGWKGLVQLALRSGQFKTINVTDVRDGEIAQIDRLTGEIKFEWLADDVRESKKIIGYVAFFELVNGFSKSLYMTIRQIEAHANKFSIMYRNKKGVWVNDFDTMAKKTVLKLLLSKYAPLSVDLQQAIIADQAVVKNAETQEFEYVDNGNSSSSQQTTITDLLNENK